MTTTTRVPQAPAAPLPELAEFLRPFHAHFVRSEGREALERYLTGLLTEQPTKNCNTIAEVVPGTSEQRLQGLLTNMVWDHEDLNDQRVRQMLTLPTEGDGVLVFDDTGFAKQGKCSVGVKRQYSGTLGRTGNCQVTVNCHYAERTLAWPVSTRLYLPKKEWADAPERRQKAKVPQEVTFQTKPEIALALLDQARALGVPHCCITADADYGDNPNFLAGLELRRERYVVAVRCDFVVATERGAPGQRADALIAAQPRQLWRSIRWREGSKATGATWGRRRNWRRWWATRTGGTGWSSITRRPRDCWAGTNTKAGCGTASTATRSV